jgi:signal transduction histidine kinase
MGRIGSQRVDLGFAFAVAVLGMVGTAFADANSETDRPVGPAAFALAGLTGLVLAVRRRWPRATLVAATAFTSTYLIAGFPYGPILVSFLVAVYTAARHLPLAKSAPVAIGALAVLLVHVFLHANALPGFLGLIPGSAWVVVPFAIGVTVRLNREAAARERAESARERAEAMRERVYEERLRVAQEVHDVVGHGLAAIKMQAEVALHLLAKKPEQAEVALSAISRTSTEALDELRATLSVVRRRSPAPGLARLDELRERMAEAGMKVDFEVVGGTRDLPSAVDLAGYRVVQESLTNVVRHGAAPIATVCLDYQTEAVVITVTNPSPAPNGFREGLGIAGMRERVTSVGGDFAAGHTPDGRFEVRARLPVGSMQ